MARPCRLVPELLSDVTYDGWCRSLCCSSCSVPRSSALVMGPSCHAAQCVPSVSRRLNTSPPGRSLDRGSSTPAASSGNRWPGSGCAGNFTPMTAAGVEPFESGLLTVRDGTQIYWEVSGDPSGPPLVYLHGGPGSGLGTGRYRTSPTAAGWCVVGLDQRACGRSRPLATAPGFDLATLTTQRMIDDIEDLREHLGIEKWLVVGGSWGSTLALAYGEAHPDRVTGFVLVLVTTGSHAELQWISESVGRIFPREWAAFAAAAQARPGQRLLDAYVHRLTDPDPQVRASAALAWCTWEDAHMSLAPRGGTNLGDRPPDFRSCSPFRSLTRGQTTVSWASRTSSTGSRQ